MNDFTDWLNGQNSWGEALRHHSIAETFQDVETFAGDLATLCATQHSALVQHEEADNDVEQREAMDAITAAVEAAEGFRSKYV